VPTKKAWERIQKIAIHNTFTAILKQNVKKVWEHRSYDPIFIVFY